MTAYEVLTQLKDALETAKNGLLWYQDRYPQEVNGCDDEAMAQIDAALNLELPPEKTSASPNSAFECPVCKSPYFGPLFENGKHVGRACKGWPSGVDRSYDPCRGKHEERFV